MGVSAFQEEVVAAPNHYRATYFGLVTIASTDQCVVPVHLHFILIRL